MLVSCVCIKICKTIKLIWNTVIKKNEFYISLYLSQFSDVVAIKFLCQHDLAECVKRCSFQ